MKLRVLLEDTVTGETGWYEEDGYVDAELAEFMWNEGNYACDCNRALFMAWMHGRDEPSDLACGDGRYIVQQATLDGEPVAIA